MRDVVIVEACRTAVGKFGGALKPLNADILGTEMIKAVLERSKLDPAKIDEVIFGHCRQTSDFSNTARWCALKAGIPESVPANTVMIACASAMLAVNNGANSIMTGQNDIVLAGGVESMTNGFFYVSNARWGVGTGSTQFKDCLTEAQINSQPVDMYGSYLMGMTAENIAEKYGITREESDKFSCESQNRAERAIKSGRFKDEIVPITVPQGRKKDPIIFDTDEFPHFGTTMEGLAKLPPAFKKPDGIVTAGSSAGRNDGAAAVLLMSAEKAEELGYKPLVKIRAIAEAGVDPRIMGMGPVPATAKALRLAGLKLEDMGLIELNEAFAAQSLGCIKEMGLEDKMDIINVNGGAVALGHPIGCSGVRILVTLIHEMKKRGTKYGLATLCVAGGMGMATIVENCD